MISVIIPSYNSEKTMGNCIKAIQSQSIKNYELEEKESGSVRINQKIEIIVVDDGSSDKTADIVKSFRTVKFFKRTHKGPASSRNFGAKMARGDILLFTDSDCEPDKNWIAEMTEPFKKDKSVVGVSGTYRTRQNEIIARFAQYEIEARHAKMADMKSIDFIGTFSAGYRKEIFQKFGGFDESFSTSAGEDPELSFRMAEAGLKMVFAPKAIVYHTHPNTLMKYLRQKFRNSYWRVYVYAKRKKTVMKGHSYTPTGAVTEAICAVLFLLSLIFYRIEPTMGVRYVIGGLLVSTFIWSTPLIYYISGKDPVIGLWSPFIIILRAFATAFGIILGLLRRLFK